MLTQSQALEYLIQLLAFALVLFTSIPVHEVSHGLVAYWLGDPTAKNAGRLTLNPFKHFDLFGTIALFLVHVGWAKPCLLYTSRLLAGEEPKIGQKGKMK